MSTGINIASSSGLTVGTTAVTSGTDGRVFFQAGGVVQQDGELFWDNTNKRLGVGTSTPSTRLDIQGTASTDSGQLGAELLSTTGWTTTGWTGDFTTGFTHTTGNTSVLSNTLAAVVNTYYQIAYTITGRTAGSVSIAFGGQSITITATGTFGPRATTTGNLTITPTTDFDGTIIISIKVISTYNATVTFKSSDGTVVNEIRNHTGIANTFIGRTAGSRNTTGNSNSFFGASAGQNNTTGIGNSFFGASAGQNNTATIFNSFFGASAGQNNTGFSNSFFGANAGLANTTGFSNSFFGANAGTNTTTGFGNSSFGQNAGANQTTGIHNIFVGRDSGRYISTGANLTIANNSIFLGYDTRSNADSQTNQIVIGHTAIGLGSNTTVVGNSSTTLFRPYGNVAIGADTAGARLDVRAADGLSNAVFRVRNSLDSANIVQINGDGSQAWFDPVNNAFTTIRSGASTLIQWSNNNFLNIGIGHSHTMTATDAYNILIGGSSTISSGTNEAIKIGTFGTSTGVGTINIGYAGRVNGSYSIKIGRHTGASSFGGTNSIHLGRTDSGNDITPDNVFMTYFASQLQSTVIRSNGSLGLFGQQNQLVSNGTGANGLTTFMGDGGNTLVVRNHTSIPSLNITDSFQLYSNDITAGNAAPHFRTENGAIVKVYQETTAVAASTLVSGVGTPLTDTDTFDGYTLKQIVKALRNQGLLA